MNRALGASAVSSENALRNIARDASGVSSFNNLETDLKVDRQDRFRTTSSIYSTATGFDLAPANADRRDTAAMI